jgi:hypothetical protein
MIHLRLVGLVVALIEVVEDLRHQRRTYTQLGRHPLGVSTD